MEYCRVAAGTNAFFTFLNFYNVGFENPDSVGEYERGCSNTSNHKRVPIGIVDNSIIFMDGPYWIEMVLNCKTDMRPFAKVTEDDKRIALKNADDNRYNIYGRVFELGSISMASIIYSLINLLYTKSSNREKKEALHSLETDLKEICNEQVSNKYFITVEYDILNNRIQFLCGNRKINLEEIFSLLYSSAR